MNDGGGRKRVLVTGGTRGIGRAIVLAFAQRGAVVHTCGRAESDASSKLRAELAEHAGEHVVDTADLGVPSECRSLVERAVKALGQLDVVVNNAGTVSHHTLDELEGDEWARVVDVNLRSTYEVTRAALPAMQAGGSIVNVASAVAMVGMPARAHYTASKAGIIGFTRSLCKETGPLGIRVNVVSPGIVETDQLAQLTPQARERYEQMAALKRLGTPDDIARVVLFLASDDSRFITGQTIVVDGGI
jgi:3-oxoacyl-[acyl-carrier protein] reductase